MPHEDTRETPLALRYAAGLTAAHLMTAAEVLAVVWSLSGQSFGNTQSLLTQTNLVLVAATVVVSTVVVAVGGYLHIGSSLRWFLTATTPDAGQRRRAINIVRHQSFLLLAVWAIGGAVLLLFNVTAGVGPTMLICFAAGFGGMSTVSASLLFTQRISRPIVAAATDDAAVRTTSPGIASRLVMMWSFNSALPSATIVALVMCKANGWLIPTTASLDIPIVVLSVVSVLLGLRALILVARSIADPVRDVVAAMADVEQGRIGRTVDVYEQSEIGGLQRGFNSMVTGLAERDRIQDLFGRHVGHAVARLAISGDDSLTGQVREVAILFIDLAGSTAMAATLSPPAVADILNDFFRIVVAAVNDNAGLINQFQGDAALVVFGRDGAATSALATARALSADLRELPVVDFGIGVSAGPVFAGNIGAEDRYEYTVIGDPVNEAARLADCAKTIHGRTMASGAAISRADAGECGLWIAHGSTVLRGRGEPTQVSIPASREEKDDGP
ncbi:putative adenylate cyclase [Mycobacterium antarcticum]|uniref:adenylate/guanylate cyclase domain-containing protein n=1 Tax=unclassified Mycolicibacterium TaxID=2636767 RepID=UPI00239438E3|nr:MULTISPECIES: adenylate/guanylate cyclase domain-containing protein [unclassified Mycolicibacterium]BDX31836.1 putative adenylate cyclase [Mycolicibacterium sp. TUM20985]GLP75134.1 putative adenylate cyclase [Mycolicibacterium sp. TUM20983]